MLAFALALVLAGVAVWQTRAFETFILPFPTAKVELMYYGRVVQTYPRLSVADLTHVYLGKPISTEMIAQHIAYMYHTKRSTKAAPVKETTETTAKDEWDALRSLEQQMKGFPSWTQQYSLGMLQVRILKLYLAMKKQGWSFKVHGLKYPTDPCKRTNADGSTTVVC